MDVVKASPSRFDVCLIRLDPTVGSEMKKTRPCVVISPDSMNESRLRTIIVAPMTSTIYDHVPTRIDVVFKRKKGQIVLDQIKTIDRSRIIKILGTIEKQLQHKILDVLKIMFS